MTALSQNRAVDDQELVSMGINAPVHAPLQHRKGLLAGERLERTKAVEIECGLWSEHPSQATAKADADMEIHETPVVDQRKVGVQRR